MIVCVLSDICLLQAQCARETGLQLSDGLNYIEWMLRRQLVGAIGREVTARDFSMYMEYHNKRIFREIYQPQPFAYAIRRPGLQMCMVGWLSLVFAQHNVSRVLSRRNSQH